MDDDRTATTQTPFRIYMSHSIRGKNGINATYEEISANLAHARKVGTEIKSYLWDWQTQDGFPELDLYVPAEHDEFVQIAYNRGFLDETEILACDCEIIDKCQLVVMYGEPYSRGMHIEYDYAVQNKIPAFKMPIICTETISALQFVIHLILTGKGR